MALSLFVVSLLLSAAPAHGSAMETLENFCQSKEWDNAVALQGLTLTGLQPCFEDMILLGMVYTGFLLLLTFRIVELLRSPKEPFLEPLPLKAKAWLACRCLLVLVEVVVPFLLLSEANSRDDPAMFERVIYPIRAVVWLLLLITLVLETDRPTPDSLFKYLLRVLYLWALIADSVRWSSQEALSNLEGLENQFTFFMAGFIALALLVIGNYFVPSKYDTKKSLIKGKGRSLDWTPAAGLSTELQEIDNPAANSDGNEGEVDPLDAEVAKTILPPKPTEKNMEVRAGPLSRILFSFISPVIRRGYKHPLEEEDIWPLAAKYSSADVAKKFHSKWEVVDQQNIQKAKADGTSDEDAPNGPGKMIQTLA
jgi:hypothetical protein